MKIQLTEQITISNKNSNYAALDWLCFLSKNLYNAALYQIRQSYIKDKKYLNYNALNKLFHDNKCSDYFALPYIQSAQQVLIHVDKVFKSYFNSLKSEKNKGKRIKLPYYKDSNNGRYIFTYTNQCAKIKDGILKLKTNNGFAYIKTKIQDFQLVRLVPKGNHIVIEIVYNKEYTLKGDNKRYASIDLGINNLCALTSNVVQSILYNGRPLKSINQFYNKKKAALQSKLNDKHTSKRISRLTYKRNKKVKDYLHKTSKSIITYLVSNSLNTLFVGKNAGWKDNVNLGKKNNQNFVSIPYNMLIQMLEYKGKLSGINVVTINEAYTSKCSFLDNEKICKHDTYVGKRTNRGLFISKSGIKINADINGSYNIMCLGLNKTNVKPDVIRPRNKRFVLNPICVSI